MVDPKMAQIPFGPGLDKESGAMVVRPGSMLDLRNVYHHEGSLVARAGMEKKIQFTDYQTGEDATHIIAGIAIRSERIGIVVSFYEPTGHVTIHRVDGTAEYGTPLGNWPYDIDVDGATTIEWPTDDVPKVVLAEIFGTVYFAHDERYASKRAPTWVYDPYFEFSDDTGLAPLKADLLADHNLTAEEVAQLPIYDPANPPPGWLDEQAAEYVRFRGVARHLDYLVGWGWGTILQTRPELVRVSYPGEPRRFHPDHYFIAGDRRDPVISCQTARKTMLVFKETETHRIKGYSRATFGIEPYDNLYGCLSGRLARTVSGEVFFWSAEGPRVGGDTGPSAKLDLPLDLGGYEPSTLVERTDFVDGWCDYIDEVELLYYGFGRRLYVLSLRNRNDPRWTYWELARKAYCGFRLYGFAGGGPPTGHPEIASATVEPAVFCDLPTLRVVVDHVDQTGEEYIQLFLRKAGTIMGKATSLFASLYDDANGDGVPDDWTADDSAVTTGIVIRSVGSLYGHAIMLTGASAADDEAVLYHDITDDVVVGDTYRLECDVVNLFASVSTASAIRIEWLDSGDSVISTVSTQKACGYGPVADPDPLRAHVEGVAPASTVKIRLVLSLKATFAGGFQQTAFRNAGFYRETTNSWFQVQLGSPGGDVSLAAQQILPTVDITEPGIDYDIAVRYVNLGGIPTPGYENGAQDTWPAASVDTVAVTPPAPLLRITTVGLDAFGNYTEFRILCHPTQPTQPKYGNLDVEIDVDPGGFPAEDTLIVRGGYYTRLYLLHHLAYGINVLKARYLGSQYNSPWSSPLNFDAGTGSTITNKPTFTISSPTADGYQIDWAYATPATPLQDGWIKSIEVWDNYNDAGGTGEYRLRWHPCMGQWGEICTQYEPADPLDIDLGASAGAVTVGVYIREVFAWGSFSAADFDGYPPSFFDAGPDTDVQSQVIA